MNHYVTLGYSPNPILEEYELQFLLKLRGIWKGNVGPMEVSDEFLRKPDIHSLLLAGDTDSLQTLQQEYSLYRERGYITGDTDVKIQGTNILLSEAYYNPSIHLHNHPDHHKSGVQIGFGEKSAEEWEILFQKVFSIVRGVSLGFMSEIDKLITKIIPFGVSNQVHNSGSYSNAIGHLLMSYPTGMSHPELALLEAILHEYNHNKLNLILQTQRLILSDYSERYYSPYRPDRRHIHGVYLGLHALSGAYWVIWQAQALGVLSLSDDWKGKALLYVLKNGLAIQVLEKYAHLTPLGEKLFLEMKQVHQECLRLIALQDLPPAFIDHVRGDLVSHYKKSQETYGNSILS